MHWRLIAAILCTYGALKEFRPTEPYLYQWQHIGLHLTAEELSIEVYPISTYANLVFLIPTLLLTDILLYKSVLLLESFSYIGVWLTLIFGTSVLSQQVGQALYGLAMSMEVAYFAYSYVKVDSEHYTRVTVWTRSALEFGRCVSYLLSEPIILLYPEKYQILNYISLISLTSTLVFALFLPNVTWREIAERHSEDSNLHQNTNELPTSYLQFVVCRARRLYADVRRLTDDAYIVKWSASWALVSCGYLQAANYIQTLWGTANYPQDMYNGFVQGLIPVVCIIVVLPLQNRRFNWIFHDLVIAILLILCAGVLFLISQVGSIWIMYAGYAAFRVLYQLAITITQCMIIKQIDVDASGFVFGLNTFLALILQTGLSIFVTKIPYFNEIHRQFVVYSVYHLLIAIVFFIFGLWRGPWSDSKVLDRTRDQSTNTSDKCSSCDTTVKFLFVNCLLLAITNAEISWNFTTTESDLIPLIVQIGTPPVDVKLKSFIGTLFSFMTDMEVPTASIHGAYDPSHSTSFQQTDVLYDFDGSVIGLIGTETFMINSVKRTLLPFAARNDSLYAYYNGIGSLGFGRPTDNNVAQSFILSLISGEKEKVVSFAMDFVDSPSTSISHIINGTVSIGSRQPKHCSGSWLELPEVVFDYDYGQWGFKIEEISVGKYSYSVDSTATFLLTNVAFSIPEPFLTSIIQLMGGDVDKLTVSCDFSDDLIFTIGGQQFHLQPSDFMLQQAATSGGQCPFLGVQKEEFFSLPATLLRNRCLLYNYENPGVAITL